MVVHRHVSTLASALVAALRGYPTIERGLLRYVVTDLGEITIPLSLYEVLTHEGNKESQSLTP